MEREKEAERKETEVGKVRHEAERKKKMTEV